MKNLTKLLFISVVFMSFTSAFAQNSDIYKDGWIDHNKNGIKDIYEDPTQSTDKRVKDLLKQMTLDEKTMQVTTLYGYGRVLMDELPTDEWKNEIWKDGIGNIDEHINGYSNKFGKININSFPYSDHAKAMNKVQKWFIEETRLGVPADMTNEAMYGVKHEKSTMVSGPIGRASAWDLDMEYRIGEMYAKEARALGYTNIYAPMLGVARIPTWARVAQTYGEDPFLVGQMGKQMILGLQDNNVASSPKHYLGYSIPLGGRDGNSRVDPQIPLRDFYNLIAEPWRVGAVEAKMMGLMVAYTDYDGEPIIDSEYWLTKVLRDQWGFDGYTVSDSDALEYLHVKHMTVNSYEEGIANAFKAGLNMRTTFTEPEVFTIPLRNAVKSGLLPMDDLDKRVSEVLSIKFRLGLFDKPYVEDEMLADKVVKSEKHKALALESARKSMVLLKNKEHTLPLHRNIVKSIALIGPLADSEHDMNPTMYSGINQDPITVKEGLIELLKDTDIKIKYTQGCEATDANFPESDILSFPITVDEQKGIDEAVELAKNSDVAILVLGDNLKSQGESRSRISLKLPGYQQELLEAVQETGTPVILVLFNGRPIQLNWADKNVNAILESWIAGEYAGQAIAETLFGDNNPSGKLPITFPKHVGQMVQAFPRKPGADGDGHARVNGDLYSFGYGLSYTNFEYSKLKVIKEIVDGEEIFKVSCKVKNTGWVDGTEVVQLYVRDEVGSVITYELNLRGFKRVDLKRKKSAIVKFVIKPSDLGLYNRNYDFVTEKGEFTISIGSSSQDIRLSEKITLDKDYTFGKDRDYYYSKK